MKKKVIKKWKKLGQSVPINPEQLEEAGKWGKGLIVQDFQDPRGKNHKFFFYTLKDSMVVLPVTKDGYVLLVREFKQGSNDVQNALPCGYREKGKTFKTTAKNEIRQETGYIPGHIIPLGYVWVIARHSNSKVNLFLALDCEPAGEQELDETEDIAVVKVPLAKWIDDIVRGKTDDNFSISATVRALPHLDYYVGRDTAPFWQS